MLVVAEQEAPDGLLERAWDARRHGATVLSLDGGDEQLAGVAHESLSVAQADLVVPELSFDSVQHLVSVATGEVAAGSDLEPGRRGLAHPARARPGHHQRLAPRAPDRA